MNRVGYLMTKRLTVVTLALLMSIGMWAQTGSDASASAALLRDQADSLYSLQQYDEAKALALEGLNTLSKDQHKDHTVDSIIVEEILHRLVNIFGLCQ